MSALPPKADLGTQPRDVCFVPKADKHLGKASNLASLNSELAAVDEAVKKLNAEKAALGISVAALAKERAKTEHELAALRTDAEMFRAERADATSEIGKIRALVENACARRSP
jgi:septal ring factor EnvC (AmiA/AmiB activator)